MTQAEFDELVSLAPGFSAEQRQVAQRVMVQGSTMTAAGADLEWSRQRVHHAVRRLERIAKTREKAEAFERAGGALPSGWENVTLSGPAELVAKWQTEAMSAAAKATKKNKRARKKIPDS